MHGALALKISQTEEWESNIPFHSFLLFSLSHIVNLSVAAIIITAIKPNIKTINPQKAFLF